MTPPLRLSVNELSSLLRQVCKATYTAHHDYITIRRTIMWMEILGFDGLKALLEDYSENQQCPRQSSFGDDPLNWPMAGNSLIPVAHMAGDMLLAESTDHASVEMVIHNATNSTALLHELERLMLAGVTAELTVDGQVMANCGEGDLNVFAGPKDWPQLAETVSLHIGGQPMTGKGVLTLADITAHRRETYDHGLPVAADIYTALNARAALCLVPSTEESRRGAGE